MQKTFYLTPGLVHFQISSIRANVYQTNESSFLALEVVLTLLSFASKQDIDTALFSKFLNIILMFGYAYLYDLLV